MLDANVLVHVQVLLLLDCDCGSDVYAVLDADVLVHVQVHTRLACQCHLVSINTP